jgi:hypothetical protein
VVLPGKHQHRTVEKTNLDKFDCRPSPFGTGSVISTAIVYTLGTVVLPGKHQHRTVEKTNLDKFGEV